MRLAAPKSSLCAAAVTLGLGAAALVAGHGVASAETAATPSPSATSAQHSAGPSGLVRAGAVDLGLVYLDSEYSTQTATTGDHDGYAVVVVLT